MDNQIKAAVIVAAAIIAAAVLLMAPTYFCIARGYPAWACMHGK
jgi:hypothetical protein